MTSSTNGPGSRRASSRLPLGLIAVVLLGGALALGLLASAGTRGEPAATAVPTVAPTPAPAATAPASAGHGDLAAAATAPRIEAAEARARADTGRAVFVDVRSGAEFEAGHIAGALSITSMEMQERLQALPPDTTIITYCSQPDEASSARAVLIFKESGYADVVALRGGFQGWQAQGFPLSTGR